MYNNSMIKENIFEVLVSLIKFTDEIDINKLEKIESKIKNLPAYQKRDIFICLLNKKNKNSEYYKKVFKLIVETLCKSKEFERYYSEQLLIENKNIFTEKFSTFIEYLNRANLFGEVYILSEDLKNSEPKLVRGENLKNGLLFLLKENKNREIFFNTANENYKDKILNFFLYYNLEFVAELKDKIKQEGVWKELFNQEKELLIAESNKFQLKKVCNLRELKTYIFSKQIENMSKDVVIDYKEIYYEKKDMILLNLKDVEFELYYKILTTLDNNDKIYFMKKSLEIDFIDSSILGLLANQFSLEENEDILEKQLINKFYEKYEKYCITKEIKCKKPGNGIYNEIDTLVGFYFKFKKKLFNPELKIKELKRKYLEYYSYYLGLMGQEKDIDLNEINYESLFRGLVYNKNNIKKDILNKIEDVEEKLITFLHSGYISTYKTKYYLNFLLEKEVSFDRLYTKKNINILKEIAIEKKNKFLLKKVLKEYDGLEYDKELFEFLFKYENENELKSILISLNFCLDLKVILFKMDLKELVEKIEYSELKILFLLWIILKVKNIFLAVEAVDIIEENNYESIEISEEMMKELSLNEYLDRERKIEIDILKSKIGLLS